MARFKINFELTGLKLQVEGNREDVPLMTQAVSQQIAGLLTPAADIIEGEIVDTNAQASAIPAPEQKPKRKRVVRQKSPSASAPKTNDSAKVDPIDWVHDPSKWGSPQQSWVTADKSIWLLYVVSKEKAVTELTAQVIAATFNKHFRQAGQVLVGNVSRDLGKSKKKVPALVSENTTLEPPAWFLTQTGVTRAQELVAKALGQTQGSGG